jgi:hypothetical protein
MLNASLADQHARDRSLFGQTRELQVARDNKRRQPTSGSVSYNLYLHQNALHQLHTEFGGDQDATAATMDMSTRSLQ